MDWTLSPTQYADPDTVKVPSYVPVTDAGADPAIRQAVINATAWVRHATGRAWVQPPDAVTLVYDASLSNRLYTDDFADTTGIVVKRNGVELTLDTDYVWLWRTIDGECPHAYALRLLSGLWADNAHTAGRDVTGDITLTTAQPCTTLTPPDLIVEAVKRVAVEYYLAGNNAYQGSSGDSDTGLQPEPGVTHAEAVLGSYIHPSRKIGRP